MRQLCHWCASWCVSLWNESAPTPLFRRPRWPVLATEPFCHLHLGPGNRLSSFMVPCKFQSVSSAAKGQVLPVLLALISLLPELEEGNGNMWALPSRPAVLSSLCHGALLDNFLWRKDFQLPNGELVMETETLPIFLVSPFFGFMPKSFASFLSTEAGWMEHVLSVLSKPSCSERKKSSANLWKWQTLPNDVHSKSKDT